MSHNKTAEKRVTYLPPRIHDRIRARINVPCLGEVLRRVPEVVPQQGSGGPELVGDLLRHVVWCEVIIAVQELVWLPGDRGGGALLLAGGFARHGGGGMVEMEMEMVRVAVIATFIGVACCCPCCSYLFLLLQLVLLQQVVWR